MRILLAFTVVFVFLASLLLVTPVQASNAMPANLVKAIGITESGWNQSARGRDGEIGIMQILPSTASIINQRSHTAYNVYSANGNVALGALLLRELWSDFGGDVTSVVSAYNAGEWSVQHYGVHNWGYVNYVLALLRRL